MPRIDRPLTAARRPPAPSCPAPKVAPTEGDQEWSGATEEPSPRQSETGHLIRPGSAGLNIVVTSGAGSGRTPLSAFDAALCAAGAGNFNLVRLSSVIPAGSRVTRQAGRISGNFGDVLYCVYAESIADIPGQQACAGLGWVVATSGGGLFVEHSGDSRAAVEEQIHLSLTDMVGRRNDSYGPIQCQVSSAICRDGSVCAVVLAAYRPVSWRPE